MHFYYIHLPYQTVFFEIKTKCINIFDELSLLYGQHVSREKPTTINKSFAIEITKQKNEYRVSTNDKNVITNNPLQIVNDIMYENTQYPSCVMALHGAAVEFKGNAYLFLASTTSGKTTLTSFLTQKGMGYITDDCILINRDTLEILPINMPMHLRNGGLQVLKKMNLNLPKMLHLQNSAIDRYVYSPRNCVLSSIPIAKVYFILRNEKENNVNKMTSIHAMIRLMKSMIIPYRITDIDIKNFQQIVEKGCHEILYKDLEYVYSMICKELK